MTAVTPLSLSACKSMETVSNFWCASWGGDCTCNSIRKYTLIFHQGPTASFKSYHLFLDRHSFNQKNGLNTYGGFSTRARSHLLQSRNSRFKSISYFIKWVQNTWEVFALRSKRTWLEQISSETLPEARGFPIDIWYLKAMPPSEKDFHLFWRFLMKKSHLMKEWASCRDSETKLDSKPFLPSVLPTIYNAIPPGQVSYAQ